MPPTVLMVLKTPPALPVRTNREITGQVGIARTLSITVGGSELSVMVYQV